MAKFQELTIDKLNAVFNLFVPVLLAVEGGFQKLRNDSGNYNSLGQLVGTNHGVAAKTYEAWIGHPPTEAEMRAMPKATAILIFRKWFWDEIRADEIDNQSVANLIADHNVNGGYKVIEKAVQRILNSKFNKGLTVDGVFGNKTIAAINSVDQHILFDAIVDERERIYHQIGGEFLQGWLNRLADFEFTSEKKKR